MTHSPPKHPDSHIDSGTLGCAQLLILLRDHVRTLPAGSLVTVTSENPIAPIDLPAWCRMTGHDWLGRTDTQRPTFAIRTGDTPVATQESSPWRTR